MTRRDDQWFFDLETKEVTQGPKQAWANRMGPYDTREEAENALKIAQERNEQADEKEDEWEDDWED